MTQEEDDDDEEDEDSGLRYDDWVKGEELLDEPFRFGFSFGVRTSVV